MSATLPGNLTSPVAGPILRRGAPVVRCSLGSRTPQEPQIAGAVGMRAFSWTDGVEVAAVRFEATMPGDMQWWPAVSDV